MSLVDTQNTEIPYWIVRALILEDESRSFEMWLQSKRCDVGSPSLVLSQSGIRPFYVQKYGAHLIQQDDNGRLCVALEPNASTGSLSVVVKYKKDSAFLLKVRERHILFFLSTSMYQYTLAMISLR